MTGKWVLPTSTYKQIGKYAWITILYIIVYQFIYLFIFYVFIYSFVWLMSKDSKEECRLKIWNVGVLNAVRTRLA
jgi:hypothetical protein